MLHLLLAPGLVGFAMCRVLNDDERGLGCMAGVGVRPAFSHSLPLPHTLPILHPHLRSVGKRGLSKWVVWHLRPCGSGNLHGVQAACLRHLVYGVVTPQTALFGPML